MIELIVFVGRFHHMKKIRNDSTPVKKQARIFSGGRITVPREVRLRMGLRPGDTLEFETDGDHFFMRRVKPHRQRRDSSLRSE
jgi:AbrB family looped-hinge helix DNA binding protein